MLGVGSEAEDAAQEATIRAWRRRATCHGAPAAWVRAIARNEALRVIDRRRDEAPLEAADGVHRELAPLTDAQAVRAAVRELDAPDRLLVLLRYWADLTQPEVARLTALPEGTVKVRLHRARLRLRVALGTA